MPRRSGRCRRLVLPACIAAICALGCQLAHRDRNLPTTRAEDRKNSDEDLLNAVLDDLMADVLLWAKSSDGREKSQLILHIQSRRPTANLTERKIRSEAKISKV